MAIVVQKVTVWRENNDMYICQNKYKEVEWKLYKIFCDYRNT